MTRSDHIQYWMVASAATAITILVCSGVFL